MLKVGIEGSGNHDPIVMNYAGFATIPKLTVPQYITAGKDVDLNFNSNAKFNNGVIINGENSEGDVLTIFPNPNEKYKDDKKTRFHRSESGNTTISGYKGVNARYTMLDGKAPISGSVL